MFCNYNFTLNEPVIYNILFGLLTKYLTIPLTTLYNAVTQC